MNLPPLGNKGSEDKAQIFTIGASRAIAAAFPQIRTIGMWRPPDGFNEHSSGMAADVMIPNWNTPEGKSLGDEVCAYALTLQGVDYVIWRQAMHYRDGRVTGMSDRGSPTQNHKDHNHVHTTGGGYPGPGQVYTATGTVSVIGARFWPLGEGRIVTSPFGARSGGFHAGVDFGRAGGSAGMPVFACQGGNVIMSGAASGYGGPDPAGWLVIDHSNADGSGCTEYGHIVREVDNGQRVAAGQRIGYINPDRGTNGGVPPHLHLAVMPQEYNPEKKMDPLPWLAGAREPGAPQIPSPPPPVLSRTDRYALAVKLEGERRGITQRGIQIAFSVCFVESNWKMYANSNVPESLAKNPDGTDKYPHDAVGSDHDSLGLFQQRSPMWGQPACLMNAACSAGLFYDRLVKMDYNDPARLPGSFAADVQRPAARYRGRYQERYGEAAALYNRLSQIAAPVEEDDFLSALSAQEQRDLFNAIMNKRQSRSPLRHVGEGQVGDSMDQIWDIDGNVHLLVLGMLASLRFPDPEALALLQEVAEADVVQFPERQRDKKLARAILAGLGAAPAARVMPTPISMPPVTYPEPEVLPAIRQPVKGNTPEDLLDTIDRLNVFRRDFDKRFDALTDEKPPELEEGK